MSDINIFTNGGVQGAGRGQVDFFLRITKLFHQCDNKNIIYQQFYCCLRYILHIVNIVVF